MKPSIRLRGACFLVLCLACFSVPAWGVDLTVQLAMTPAPIARGDTLTIGMLLGNESGVPLANTTLYVPLPVGIDQWAAEVRIDGGAWLAYPANGLIALDPIPALGQMAVDIQVPIEQGASATLTVTAQLLNATGILAEAIGWVNVLPNVDAGPDLIVDLGRSVTLVDASASDGGGLIVAYLWTDSGAGGTFDDSGMLRTTYTPLAVSGVVILGLTVTDADGGESSDSLRVRVNAVPNVEIGGDVDAEEGGSIQLWQTAVSDPDGWIAGIMWSDGGAGGTFLPSNDVLDPVYLVPEIAGCGDAVIVLTLVLTDNWGATSTDTLNVTVANINELPVVYVPEDREVEAGQRVDLSAIASDEDGWIEAQAWEQVDGIEIDLMVSGLDQHVLFDAPDVAAPTELVFRFRAIDNCGAEAWDEVTVTVFPVEGSDDAPVTVPPDGGYDDTPVTVPPDGGSGDAPLIDGSLTINMDVFDDRGFPLSSFDTPSSGDSITIRVTVTNTGPLLLGNLTGTLNNGNTVPLRSNVLEPWGSTTGTSEWLVRFDDRDDGLEIVATAAGTDALGRTFTASDAFRFLGESSSGGTALVLEKTASVSEAGVGEVIVYRYQMTNTGSNDLVGLTLYDDELGWIDLPAAVLRAGRTIETQVSYTVRGADLPGPLVNRVVATGFTQQGAKIAAEAEASVELIEVAGGGGAASGLGGRVVISEIAWAGSAGNPAGEWIELANIGTAAVDLTGWRLSWYAKTGTVPPSSQWQSIELSGVIQPLAEEAWRTTTLEFEALEDGLWSVRDPRWAVQDIAAGFLAGGFFVIERAHDGVIANVRAGLVYGDAVNPYFELPDVGAAIFLIDPNGKFVDSANAQYVDRTGWPAGNVFTRATMERINLSQGDFDGNWQTTPGVLTYGVDASGRSLLATAGMPNSLPLETLLQHAAASVGVVLATGGVSVLIPESTASDRPTIQIASLAGTGAAGGGGATGSPELSTTRNGGALTVKVDLERASSGAYFVWITLKDGRTLLLPLRK